MESYISTKLTDEQKEEYWREYRRQYMLKKSAGKVAYTRGPYKTKYNKEKEKST